MMKSKKWEYVVVIFGAGVSILLAVVLGAIELRMLIAGDMFLYESPTLQMLRYFFRFFCMLMLIGNGVVGIVGLRKKGAFFAFTMLMGFASMIVCITTLFFYEWYIALALSLANLLVLSSPVYELAIHRFFLVKSEAEE